MKKRSKEEDDDLNNVEIMIMCANTSSDITVYMFDEDVFTEEELRHIKAVAGKRPRADKCQYTENYRSGRDVGKALSDPGFLASLVYVGIALKQFSDGYDSEKKDVELRKRMPNPIRTWEELATLVYSSDVGEFTIPTRKIEAKVGMRCFKMHHFIVDDYYH